jgi:hypothetical protein
MDRVTLRFMARSRRTPRVVILPNTVRPLSTTDARA